MESKVRVYVAAASSEVERATLWVGKIREAGLEPLCGWRKSVIKHGGNPREALSIQRRRWAAECLGEVSTCDVFWCLVPRSPRTTCGAWIEAGYAYSLARQLVFSGDTRQSVFCALGVEFDHDEDAFRAIVAGLGTKGIA